MLQLAEAISDGIFYDLTESELATLVGSIAGDAHRVYYSLAPNPMNDDVYSELSNVIDRVRRKYNGPITTRETEVVPDAGLTVFTWLHSENWASFASLLRLSGVAEGDAARVITQTADHLQQLSRLRDSHPDLAKMAYSVRSQLLRPPLSESLVISM